MFKKGHIINKGRHHSEETIEKLKRRPLTRGAFKKGCVGLMKGKHRSNEAKEKSSRTQKGRSYSGSFKKGHDGYWKDKHLSDER